MPVWCREKVLQGLVTCLKDEDGNVRKVSTQALTNCTALSGF